MIYDENMNKNFDWTQYLCYIRPDKQAFYVLFLMYIKESNIYERFMKNVYLTKILEYF